jgi:hypothetical protein
MLISTKKIEEELLADFSRRYKAFGDFVDSGEIWDLCKETIHDVKLMNHIIFCNDIHQIPPTNSFLKARKANEMRELTELEKRSIGAFWGFVFKFVFGYRNQKSVAARVNTVKTASYFFDVAEPIEVIANNSQL